MRLLLTMFVLAACEPEFALARARRINRQQYVAAVQDIFNLQDNSEPGEPGLRGEYVNDEWLRIPGVLIRTDPIIDFDYGDGSPAPQIRNENFSVRWTGSILSKRSGVHQFCVISDDGVNFDINNLRIINEFRPQEGVKEVCRDFNMRAGRYYPLVLEYGSFTGRGEVHLYWTVPGHVKTLIPTESLRFNRLPLFIDPDIVFPNDAQGTGFEEGGPFTFLHADISMRAAENIAALLVGNDKWNLGCWPDWEDNYCAESFIRRVLPRAFRRTVSEEEIQSFLNLYNLTPDFSDGMTRMISALLQSPNFIYRFQEIDDLGRAEKTTGDEMASLLSFFIWGSVPDQTLRDAAASGQLQTKTQISDQVTRMLADTKAINSLTNFLRQWLHLSEYTALTKDPQYFPDFTEDTVFDLNSSFDHLIADQWSNSSVTFADLFSPTKPNLLTHPLFPAKLASASESSPILRGAAILDAIFCQPPPPPPANIQPLSSSPVPGLTTRQKVERHTAAPMCQGCHSAINQVGFLFENYDAVGRFRSVDAGAAVDSSGGITTKAGEHLSFHGPDEFSDFIGQSIDARQCFVRKLFRYAHGRLETAEDEPMIANLTTTLSTSGATVRDLIYQIALSKSFSGHE